LLEQKGGARVALVVEAEGLRKPSALEKSLEGAVQVSAGQGRAYG
jgi:hypothetical protein